MLRGIILAVFVFIFGFINAQTSHFLDSIDLSLKERPRFLIDYGTRNSFVAGRRAQMSAVRFGVTFGEKFSAGGGYNELTGRVYRTRYISKGTEELDRLRVQYMAYFIEYTFYKTKHWEFTIPVQLGLGRSFYHPAFYVPNSLINYKMFNPKFILVYEPTMSCTYNFNRWLGTGVDVGYRVLLLGRKSVAQKFNSPIYVLSIKLYYGTMYRDIKKYIYKK